MLLLVEDFGDGGLLIMRLTSKLQSENTSVVEDLFPLIIIEHP